MLPRDRQFGSIVGFWSNDVSTAFQDLSVPPEEIIYIVIEIQTFQKICAVYNSNF